MTSRTWMALAGAAAVVALTVSGGVRAQTEAEQREAPAFSPVTAERLLNADAEPHNWLMYSGNYMAQRYHPPGPD